MKTLALAAALLALAFAAPTFAAVDYTRPEVRNPQNDPDVDRGWREHQQSHQRRSNDNYEVHQNGTVKQNGR